MEFTYINTIDTKFAFLTSNRNISTNKDLVESIKEKGVLQPITVINGNNIGTEQLYDVNTNTEVAQENKGDYYVVLDGQHRLTILMNILKEKSEVSDADKTIPALVITQEEVGDNVNKYIITLNSTSKNWKDNDYIKNAVQIKPNDELIQAINTFERRKFSMSTISRYICLNNHGITKKTVTEYVYNNKDISYADYKRAIRLYLFLRRKGISDSFLKKRYMIDYIAEMKKQNDNINYALNLINYLQKGAIDAINSLKESKDNVSDTIDKILHQNFRTVLKEADSEEQKQEIENPKNYLAMVSDEEVRKFIEQSVGENPAKQPRPSKMKGKVQKEVQEKAQKGPKKDEQTSPQETMQEHKAKLKEGEQTELKEEILTETKGGGETKTQENIQKKSSQRKCMVTPKIKSLLAQHSS